MTYNKYREVPKTKEQNHVGSVLSTSSMNTKIRCASTCDNSECISFSYNSVTHECKTYSDEICYRDDGVGSSSLKFYTKIVQFVSLSNCGYVPTAYCSGVYTLTPATGNVVSAYCDMDTAGGPWTNMKLRIEMEGWSAPRKHVEYTTFNVSDEATEYTLTIGGYSTPDELFNALNAHNGWPFSTRDNDNDGFSGDCASSAHGGWWYEACIDCNLFGNYTSNNGYSAMLWKYFYPTDTSYTAIKTLRLMLKEK
ncbi:fibrinogen-like protein A [Mizuhopecten yessoensis]|uniref:fibrinogen-like protein A n=1 Tax=Mizuhopecten yessoensis TaxID=6573 RepID=UPI000B45E730|nr:fibrinogen-like protein A [Mizuhopecten yessoensis]